MLAMACSKRCLNAPGRAKRHEKVRLSKINKT